MLRILPWLVGVVLVVWTLVDCISTPEAELRGLPKVLWVLLMLIFAPLGSVVYLFAGRPKRPIGVLSAGSARRVVAPDDDPEFLDSLRRRNGEQHGEDGTGTGQV